MRKERLAHIRKFFAGTCMPRDVREAWDYGIELLGSVEGLSKPVTEKEPPHCPTCECGVHSQSHASVKP
jgi:hypothetical protein